MRTLFIAFAGLILFVAVFWLGLMMNFPGKDISRYIEHRINRDPRFALRLSPVELKWNRAEFARVGFHALVDGQMRPVVALQGAEIPISFTLFDGVSFQAAIEGGGLVTGFWPWRGGEARLTADGIAIGNLPVTALLAPVELTGELNLQAVSGTKLDEKGQLPPGRLQGSGVGIVVDQVDVMGFSVPPVRIDRIDFQLIMGRNITVEQINFQGDIEGTLTGNITPVLKDPKRSNFQIDVSLAFRPAWIESWGEIRPLVAAYLDGGRLDGTLQGSLARPQFRKSRRRE